jgi:hypothetical protein
MVERLMAVDIHHLDPEEVAVLVARAALARQTE